MPEIVGWGEEGSGERLGDEHGRRPSKECELHAATETASPLETAGLVETRGWHGGEDCGVATEACLPGVPS